MASSVVQWSQISSFQLPARSATAVHVVRDDLIHPLYGGNKARKLDALLPSLAQQGVTHVVSNVFAETKQLSNRKTRAAKAAVGASV